MGKIRKTNADKTQKGSNRWAGPMQSFVFLLFLSFSFSLLFFLFVPRLVIRRMRKGVAGIGGGERGKERKEKKREKRERGEGKREKSVNFAFF